MKIDKTTDLLDNNKYDNTDQKARHLGHWNRIKLYPITLFIVLPNPRWINKQHEVSIINTFKYILT